VPRILPAEQAVPNERRKAVIALTTDPSGRSAALTPNTHRRKYHIIDNPKTTSHQPRKPPDDWTALSRQAT
jgi:hypothetical protein